MAEKKYMKRYRKHLSIVLLLALVCAGLLWHIQSFQDNGRYAEMNDWIGTSKTALTVVYDIGLMLLLAGALGLLFSRIVNLIIKK
jgi:hypothetical protein